MAILINILVIDDDDIIREVWKDFFDTFERYKIDTAPSGERGLTMLRHKKFDIVITDLNMPGIDGLEVVKEIKKKHPATEVIMMTAYGSIEIAVEAMQEGAYDFILKPLDFNRVSLTIDKCYERVQYIKENKDLKKVNIKLNELNDEKDKFIAITNHELRTPTNSIVGLVDVLYESISEEEKNKFSDIFEVLIKSSNHLRDIVESMHDLSRARMGFLSYEKTTFSVDELLSDLQKTCCLFLAERDITVEFSNNIGNKKIGGDYSRLRQATCELIQNAIKFTKDGGKVVVAVENENIESVNHTVISVTDTGIGIPEEEISKIFKSFYEIQDTTMHHTSKTEFMGGGMGIGLSIVAEIVAAHNAEIKVESTLGKGTKFKILLPSIDT